MNEKVVYIKYNEDDIVEILLEYVAEKNKFGTFSSNGLLLGKPSENLRFIGVISELENEIIDKIDLCELDNEMNFNGTHNSAKGYTKEEILTGLKKMIDTGIY